MNHSLLFLLTLLIQLQFHQINGNRQNNVEWHLEKIIKNHQVVLFSKTYCQYSNRLKQLIRKYNIKDKRIMELNLERDMHLMQDYLKRKSGGIRTVPQLYVNGTFIGDFSTIERKEKNGELTKIFSRAGILKRRY